MIKVKAFMISGGLAAIAGGLYGQYTTYINPGSFTIEESILVLSMVIIGGAGTQWGPVVGAVIITFLPQVLRLVWLPEAIAPNLRQILYGALLVAFIMFRTQGIMGKRKIT
jgi:branched-chain amino acid transport system permease protein